MLGKEQDDCRSNTGQNLWKRLKIAKKCSVNDFVKLTYKEFPPEDIWKIQLAKEIIYVNMV